MPELPEVEVTRRSFADRIEGARVQALHLGAPLRWPLGTEASALQGCRVGAVSRRGKYLWMPLEGRGGLLLHLGMSGSLTWSDAPGPAGRHDHFELQTDRGTLRLTDPRRFGAVVWSPAINQGRAGRLLQGLGAEPFDASLTDLAFHESLRRRRAPIKQVLLAGDIVVGAGNIYACEALFAAGIDPRTPALRLSRIRAARLLQAVRQTLARALEQGGSTLRDFRDAHGTAGSFQLGARVYDREGQPCLTCGRPVKRVIMAQRSTYFCPWCQRR